LGDSDVRFIDEGEEISREIVEEDRWGFPLLALP
jgi:hypothetical protein